ncbi:MAG: hypothetical protein ACRDU8_04270 [Egibacteraceae bacterium]
MTVKRAFWVVVGLGVLAVAFGLVEARYVFAPLLGLAILRIGIASFGSLRAGAAHIPDGPPEPVDPSAERVTYHCDGCGAELLLLVRGAAVPPRHCGERMSERREVAGFREPELSPRGENSVEE